jgi:hypothetical protein
MHPVVALVTAGVEMDVLGLTYPHYSDAEREAVVKAFPRTPQFKEDIVLASYDGITHKPDTTFGNVKAAPTRSRISTGATSAASSANRLGRPDRQRKRRHRNVSAARSRGSIDALAQAARMHVSMTSSCAMFGGMKRPGGNF